MRALNTISSRLASLAIFAASSALAVGPDAWMEWVTWGTTMIPHDVLRGGLAAVAVIALLALIVPALAARQEDRRRG